MYKNSNDEILTENVIKIPKDLGEVSDGEDSTMYSSDVGVEEIGPYY